MHVSRLTKSFISHSWQGWRSIYNNHIDFKISLIMIWVQRKQAMLMDAQRYKVKHILRQSSTMLIKTFWIFYFLWVFGFLTHKKEKIDLKQPCKNIWCKIKQTSSLQLKQPTSTQPNIGSINAWTCCNAYAWLPFFTHTSRAFGMISP